MKMGDNIFIVSDVKLVRLLQLTSLRLVSVHIYVPM
jgi:hypothetical protein